MITLHPVFVWFSPSVMNQIYAPGRLWSCFVYNESLYVRPGQMLSMTSSMTSVINIRCTDFQSSSAVFVEINKVNEQ